VDGADASGERYFPHEFMYRILLGGQLAIEYQIDPRDSWLLAAAERNLPMKSSPGANSESRRRNSSSKATPASWRR